MLIHIAGKSLKFTVSLYVSRYRKIVVPKSAENRFNTGDFIKQKMVQQGSMQRAPPLSEEVRHRREIENAEGIKTNTSTTVDLVYYYDRGIVHSRPWPGPVPGLGEISDRS